MSDTHVTHCIVFSIRWGNTPLDDAMQFGHDVVVSVLQEYQREYSEREAARVTEEQKQLDTLKSVV